MHCQRRHSPEYEIFRRSDYVLEWQRNGADGTESGIRLSLFDYSGKVVLTIKDYNKRLLEAEQERNMIGNVSWVINNRLLEQLWELEP